MKMRKSKQIKMASPWLLILSLSLLCLNGWSRNTKPQEQEYECVDIDKQPSLQHPMLKNHRIQMRPSDEALAMLSRDASSNNDEAEVEFDIPGEGCPQGQVPILKPRNFNQTRNLFQPRNFNHTRKSFHPNAFGAIGQHAAIIKKIDNKRWRGGSAVIGIHNPKVTNKEQYSMAVIRLSNTYNGRTSTALFGWAVAPDLYGDNRTRLTAYHSRYNDDDGCYNVVCKGFIQVDKKVYLGAPFMSISVKGGLQYGSFFSIHQDPKTQNILLTVDKIYLGYWPLETVPLLISGARVVYYGGITLAPSDGLQPYDIVSPEMGNGNKPLEVELNISHTCYMYVVKYLTEDYRNLDIEYNKVAEDADAGKCYDVFYVEKFKNRGQTFFFGGPGGSCED